jgi:hypothetical protein
VVVVSYSDILARSHANDFRRVVNDPLYRATFPTMWLDRDTDREIATTKRGKRIATSIDGTLTGLGGNLIIIDDPLKLGDAMSEAVRARVIEWYRFTLLSRGDDKTTTRIVVVMQRVHQNDLAGRAIKGAIHHDYRVGRPAPETQHISASVYLYQSGRPTWRFRGSTSHR